MDTTPRSHLYQRLLLTAIIILLVFSVLLLLKKTSLSYPEDSANTQPPQSTIPTTEPMITTNPQSSSIEPDERSQIDIWIEENDLNFYGDSKESAYAGGTPLFDESTGTYIDRYEYIVNNHPDRPWQN